MYSEPVKRTYAIAFRGRPRGAPAGWPILCTQVRSAINEHEAVLALYDAFEHIQVCGIGEVPVRSAEKLPTLACPYGR